MLSRAKARSVRRRLDNERRMTRRQERERKTAFTKRLGKAIGVGLFAYITMITGQVAGWIAWSLILWSLSYGAWAVDKQLEWRWAPWQR